MMSSSSLSARVYAIRYEAEGIVSVELRPANSQVVFPAFTPGAHIDLHLPNGLVRNYSLCQPQTAQPRYVVAVLHDRHSRGGSRYVHEQLRVGSVINISAPRNHFALDPSENHVVLLAGGIGVTPIWCMLQHLHAQARSVEIIYCARSRQEAAFLEEMLRLCATASVRCTLHFDQEQGGPPDLTTLLADKGEQTHYYCCGPAPMLDAFEKTCAQLGYVHAHLERFAAAKVAASTSPDASFEVRLERSGITVEVPAGKSILDAILDAGVDHDHSCKEGVCGSCEARILDGVADHRDGVLSKYERESGQTMMICVSRCLQGPLVLDV